MEHDPGVHNPKCIDLITETPQGDVVLVMVEQRPWDGSDERLMQLQDKVNSYLAFALDGPMASQYPETKSKRVLLRLDCLHEPDITAIQIIETIREQIKPIPIEIRVR